MPITLFPFVSKKSQKSAAKVVSSLKESLTALETGAEGEEKEKIIQEEINKNLHFIKEMITAGEPKLQPSADKALAKFALEFHSCNLILQFIEKLSLIEFPSKKILADIFHKMVLAQTADCAPTVEYINENPHILFELLAGYEHGYLDVCHTTGKMIRSCVYQEPLAKILLHSEAFYKLFKYVNVPAFDASSDAFWTMRDLLTRHKRLGADFLDKNFDKFFMQHYNQLLQSENYATRRSSIEFLVVLLLNQYFFKVMKRYISLPENLQIILVLLIKDFEHIQYEAFNMFKAFVVNPDKPKPILDVLLNNRAKLLKILPDFLKGHITEECFGDDKAIIIKHLMDMKPLSED